MHVLTINKFLIDPVKPSSTCTQTATSQGWMVSEIEYS
uniref:Uncharacterized protein n=1 Tax=Rhizophora mucronata TaxID=61149 RepID=A0A2P2QDG7_RHIMU